ncbi:unnamed protein product [Scytosiphon promiscuus]
MMPQGIGVAGQPPEKTKTTKSTKKTTKTTKKKAKPKKDLTQASKLRNGGAAAYWGYKAFQAMRVCSGDVTVVAEIATELLAEGVCAGAVANPGMVVEAVEAVVDSYGGMKAFRTNVTNFAQFSGALSKQLNSDGKPQTDGKMMDSSQRLYNSFVECDSDGSGGVSKEEYVFFCSRQGVPRDMAETTFFQADVDGDGQISFEEWTAMMAGRVGRDKGSFNCGGHHGLTEYVTVCSGLACDFCGTPIPAGSPAKGCRRCDCDACASCSGLSSPAPNRPSPPAPAPARAAPPPVPPRRPSAAAILFDCRLQHGLTLAAKPRGLPVSCDWCSAPVPAGAPAVGCRVCDMDGCMNCAAVSLTSSPDGNACGLTCPGRHGLMLMQATAGGALTFRCFFCQGNVGAGAMLFSCRICRVDACVACIWKDHCRALSTGGVFTCPEPTAHQLRTWIFHDPRQLRQRCDWCCGMLSLGRSMQRCDACDVDVYQACLVTLPEQQAKVARVKAATNAARTAAHLSSMSINAPARTGGGAEAATGAGYATGPGPATSSRPPPPRYSTTPAPSHGAPAAAAPAKVPSYDEMMADLAAAGAPSPGKTATAAGVTNAPGGGGNPPPPPPAYGAIVGDGAAPPSTKSGKTGSPNAGSSPPASCSPERETPLAPAAVAGAGNTGMDSPFPYDSVVRVIGVGDPEMDGKLHTVIGFEPSEDGASTREGLVVLQRRGKVVCVSASQVYKVIG